MFTLKDYRTRKVLGTFKTAKELQKKVNELGLMIHHKKGNTYIAID